MAVMKMYSIYDNAARAFGAPYPATTPGVAERIFKDMVRNPQYKFGTYPDDYSLHYVGEFDESTGQMTPHPVQMAVTARAVLESVSDSIAELDIAKLSGKR